MSPISYIVVCIVLLATNVKRSFSQKDSPDLYDEKVYTKNEDALYYILISYTEYPLPYGIPEHVDLAMNIGGTEGDFIITRTMKNQEEYFHEIYKYIGDIKTVSLKHSLRKGLNVTLREIAIAYDTRKRNMPYVKNQFYREFECTNSKGEFCLWTNNDTKTLTPPDSTFDGYHYDDFYYGRSIDFRHTTMRKTRKLAPYLRSGRTIERLCACPNGLRCHHIYSECITERCKGMALHDIRAEHTHCFLEPFCMSVPQTLDDVKVFEAHCRPDCHCKAIKPYEPDPPCDTSTGCIREATAAERGEVTKGTGTAFCRGRYYGDFCQYDCAIGKYLLPHVNSYCDGVCRCSASGAQCTYSGGRCQPPGCIPGYRGDSCDKNCEDGRYGAGCAEYCGHCAGGGAMCHHITGKCTNGCADGYKNDYKCYTECDKGTYGHDCTGKCRVESCESGRICDRKDGNCDKECGNWTYGQFCNERCGHCDSGVTCTIKLGRCKTKCMAGYRDRTCKLPCSAGRYGDGCGACHHCAAGAICHHITGVCPVATGCMPGYVGHRCNTKCASRKWGKKCATDCGHCQDGDVCNFVTGHCPSGKCQPRWKSSLDPIATCDVRVVNCPIGRYGATCTQECGKCAGEKCHRESGACPSGCTEGYVGANCDVACTAGTYGINCQETCHHCAPGNTCDRLNGWCPFGRCGVGYRGKRCALECVQGYYGADCGHTCQNCGADVTCNHVTGKCPPGSGCKVGYFGDSCRSKCTAGTYGAGCGSVCGHCVGACHHVHGTCPQCADGYRGSKCVTLCSPGTYGQQCGFRCEHCLANSVCNRVDGKCPSGCTPGYIGNATHLTRCDQKCEGGTYGRNCGQRCSCESSVACDPETGTCPGACAPGYDGTHCHRECEVGKFGAGCTSVCGTCNAEAPCDHRDGSCRTGCPLGYIWPTCLQRCLAGSFGDKCKERCHCELDVACDTQVGTCPGECSIGFTGSSCDREIASKSTSKSSIGIIAGSLAGVLLLALVIALVAFIIKRRREDKPPLLLSLQTPPSTRQSKSGGTEQRYNMDDMSSFRGGGSQGRDWYGMDTRNPTDSCMDNTSVRGTKSVSFDASVPSEPSRRRRKSKSSRRRRSRDKHDSYSDDSDDVTRKSRKSRRRRHDSSVYDDTGERKSKRRRRHTSDGADKSKRAKRRGSDHSDISPWEQVQKILSDMSASDDVDASITRTTRRLPKPTKNKA